MQRSNKLILGVVLGCFVFLGCVVALVSDIFLNVPDFKLLRSEVKMPIYLPNDEKVIRPIGPNTPTWVPITQVSHNLVMAVVASEDTSYFSHDGVDYHELREAIKKDLNERRFARGASTITQQVIKNVYLDRSKTIWRKIREFLWAREMDKTLTKSEILGVYVNIVEWGPGIYGIKEASYHYFGVAPSQLTAKQSAFLAMLLPSPVKYHKYFVDKSLTAWAAHRVRQILRVMVSMKFVDPGAYEVALREPLWGNPDSEPPLTAEESAPVRDNEAPPDEFPSGDDPIMQSRPIVKSNGKPSEPGVITTDVGNVPLSVPDPTIEPVPTPESGPKMDDDVRLDN